MTFVLQALPYAYDALEPAIDAATMEVHYTKHYQGYTNKLNAALEAIQMDIDDADLLMTTLTTIPISHQSAVRNNGGGYYNHSMFWEIMSPEATPATELFERVLSIAFRSMEEMKEQFEQAAAGRFGSGWAWIVLQSDGSLAITSTPNQDNPLMDDVEVSGYPILGLDVWEHAYYLHYQNRRADYIRARWDVVDWAAVERRYDQGREFLGIQ